MSPLPRTTQPTSTARRNGFLTTVAFPTATNTEIAVDLGDTEYRGYKLFAASANPDPRSNTDPLDIEPIRPPSGRLIGDGQYSPDVSYTVQVTYYDANNQPVVLTGQVPAHDAVPHSQVYLTLT
ncbi:MAG: hypothetical protein DHS20C15_29570 [Planctomycetota bacterium]|nr:MAG: hypothetical protein DHS20C15_29570 [Planctomycetota bacterium]